MERYEGIGDYRACFDIYLDVGIGSIDIGARFSDLPQNGNDAASILYRRHIENMLKVENWKHHLKYVDMIWENAMQQSLVSQAKGSKRAGMATR